MNAPPPDIFTIGHSTRAIGDFLDLLRAHQIVSLADVRSFPGSRRYPQFNQGALSAALRAAGIDYHHMAPLGGRRKKQAVAQPDTRWRNPAFANYADYAQTEPFRAGLEALESLARDRRVAIMCAEALWWRCHRRIIAEELTKDGFAVTHIMAPGRDQPADRSPQLPGL